jgi:5-methyltetrahydrofolate--homocysteine methyltransferase
MTDILKRLGREVLVIDGAFGTMLQRVEIPPEQCPEQLNITAPDVVGEIHRNYVLAGADCVTTNSFGGTRFKLAEYGLEDQVEQFSRAAVRLARASGALHILGEMGPTGRVLEPLGEATFDEVFEAFAEQAAALAAEYPDAIIIETMTDIAEARCAVLAARFACDLPVLVTCTFGLGGRMDLSGTDPATAAVILEAAGAAAVGMNCGLGPEQMLPLLERMLATTALPVIVQPNAGLPRLVDGRTVFPGTADEMGEHAARFVKLGAAMVGSCCGSSPSFTGAIVDFAKELPIVADRAGKGGLVLAGPRGLARIGSGQPIRLIGERINPTGRPELADSLREGSTTVVRTLAAEQQHAGAHALDVNVGAAGVDAAVALPAAVLALVGFADIPLVIDTTDASALEAALRVYPGRALVNSVNGAAASLETVLPLVAAYGAAVVVLALDDDGIPATVEGRLEIVQRVRAAAHAAGLADTDLLVDALVMTAATDPDAARVTLETTRAVSRDLGLATLLGVSNVSHGLPGRPALNAAFLAMTAAAGLDAAIVNPSDRDVAGAVKAADVLLGADEQAAAWIAWCAATDASEHARPGAGDAAGGVGDTRAAHELSAAVIRGDSDGVPALVDAVIRNGLEPGHVIGSVLTPAIQDLGEKFGRGEVFLPQLMVSAEAMKAAVERVKTYLPEGDGSGEGRVVFATVKGDIHSIGKDICVSLLESQGFAVRDLGVDIAEDVVLEAAGAADAVCLSALMTTTLPSMRRVVEAVADRHPGLPVLVGGAVVTAEWAREIGAGYSADAPGCVIAVREAIAKGRG